MEFFNPIWFFLPSVSMVSNSLRALSRVTVVDVPS
jgi:hypothetical protein